MISFYKKVDFNKIYYYTILIFAFFLPLSRASISLFIIILPIIWLIEGDLKRKFLYIKSNKILLTLSVFLIYSWSSIFFTQDINSGINMIRLGFYMFSFYVIATSLKKEYVTSIVTAFLTGMFISEIIAYGVFFEIWKFKDATPFNPSPFMMHIDYSVFMAFTSILLLNRLLSNHYKIKEKLIYLFFFLTVTGNLFLAIGRTGQMALIFAIIVLTIIHFRISIKSLLMSILLLTTIFVTAFSLSNSFQTRLNQSTTDINNILNNNFNGSWGIRVAFWITTINQLRNNPFGSGIGDFEVAIKEELKKEQYSYLSDETKSFMIINHPHNQYLLVLLQTGLIGIILFLYFIYQLFKLNIKDKELKELSILFFTVYFISCMPEPLLIKQFTLALFVLFGAVFVSLNESKNLSYSE